MRDDPARNHHRTPPQRIQDESVHFTAQLKSPEAREAFAAFREKRQPDFGKVEA